MFRALLLLVLLVLTFIPCGIHSHLAKPLHEMQTTEKIYSLHHNKRNFIVGGSEGTTYFYTYVRLYICLRDSVSLPCLFFGFLFIFDPVVYICILRGFCFSSYTVKKPVIATSGVDAAEGVWLLPNSKVVRTALFCIWLFVCLVVCWLFNDASFVAIFALLFVIQ